MIAVHKVPPDLVINWDQTPIAVAPSQNWSMAEEGSQRIEVPALVDKRKVTSTLAVTHCKNYLVILTNIVTSTNCYFNINLVNFTVLCWFTQSMCNCNITKHPSNTTFVSITFVCHNIRIFTF